MVNHAMQTDAKQACTQSESSNFSRISINFFMAVYFIVKELVCGECGVEPRVPFSLLDRYFLYLLFVVNMLAI